MKLKYIEIDGKIVKGYCFAYKENYKMYIATNEKDIIDMIYHCG